MQARMQASLRVVKRCVFVCVFVRMCVNHVRVRMWHLLRTTHVTAQLSETSDTNVSES